MAMKIDKAIGFELLSLTGKRETLSALLTSGPVLLAFYKVTCPTCQLIFPFLERIHQGEGPGTPRVIAISQDDPRATADFNQRFGATFLTLLDPKEDRYPVSNAYGITNVPTLFLIEPEGCISDFAGAFDKAMLERLATRFRIEVFTPADRVPVFRPG